MLSIIVLDLSWLLNRYRYSDLKILKPFPIHQVIKVFSSDPYSGDIKNCLWDYLAGIEKYVIEDLETFTENDYLLTEIFFEEIMDLFYRWLLEVGKANKIHDVLGYVFSGWVDNEILMMRKEPNEANNTFAKTK